MTAPTHAELSVLSALRAGAACPSPEEWAALVAAHLGELAERLTARPPDCPLDHLHADYNDRYRGA